MISNSWSGIHGALGSIAAFMSSTNAAAAADTKTEPRFEGLRESAPPINDTRLSHPMFPASLERLAATAKTLERSKGVDKISLGAAAMLGLMMNGCESPLMKPEVFGISLILLIAGVAGGALYKEWNDMDKELTGAEYLERRQRIRDEGF